jgi:hypothetical protein
MSKRIPAKAKFSVPDFPDLFLVPLARFTRLKRDLCVTHHFINTLGKPFYVPCIKPRHGDASVGSHVDMVLLCKYLRLSGVEPSETDSQQ